MINRIAVCHSLLRAAVASVGDGDDDGNDDVAKILPLSLGHNSLPLFLSLPRLPPRLSVVSRSRLEFLVACLIGLTLATLHCRQESWQDTPQDFERN